MRCAFAWQVAAGGAHSAVVGTGGRCYTWGKNNYGQLGHGHVTPVVEPEIVYGLPRKVAWIACGGAHTVALVDLP